MSETTLKQVLDEIQSLDANELHEVERAVRELLIPASKEAERDAALRVLETSGLVHEVKRPPMVARPQRLPVPIDGKPLSHTIIEERR